LEKEREFNKERGKKELTENAQIKKTERKIEI
jgi:hypothetical protein